ncbi:MAG: hypothetical protein U0263_10290 [Polyangiaceae bacterium]
MRMLDKWTITASAALLIGALLACKKKEEPAPTPPPEPTPAATPTASAEPPKDDKKDDKKDVTRYGDKEKDESGTVAVVYPNAKIYKEADDSKDHIATLSKGTLVNRKARYGNWMLVDWPSGVGELSPGWIVSKHLDDKVLKIDIDKVKNQDAGVQISDAAAPTPDATTTTPDAAVTTPDASTPPPDAAAPTTQDAGKGGRLTIPPKKIQDALKK